MIPGQGLFRLLAAWLGLSLLAAAVPALFVPWLALGLGLLVAMVVTGVRVARAPALTVDRQVLPPLPLGEWSEVRLRLESEEQRDLRLDVFDHNPTSAELEGQPASATVPANDLLELVYRLRPRRRGDVHFGRVEIWRRSVFDLVRRRFRRRALVLMMTNLRDEFAAELLPAIQVLRRRHLVLVASTRELALARLRDQPVTDHRSALAVSAAHLYLAARRGAHAAVRGAGAFILDVEPPELPVALVARYLDIKRAGQL